MAVITISRQSGSEGNKITKILCERLGWGFFDKNMMAEIAREKGLDPEKVEDITADKFHAKGFWEEVFGNFYMPGIDPHSWVLVAREEAWEELTVRQVKTFINAAYEKGNVIIVGRGSQFILGDKPDVLHVRIVAPLEVRIKRWQAREDVSYEEAQKIVKKRNQRHIDFVKTYFHRDINNLDLYDLVINTEKLSLVAAADVIIKALESLSYKPDLST